MIEGRACGKVGLTVLLLVLTSAIAGAHTVNEHAHRHAERAEAAKHAAVGVHAGERHVYFRPFCRRARYVTNRSAPCWE
jgi:hypothetical protein